MTDKAWKKWEREVAASIKMELARNNVGRIFPVIERTGPLGKNVPDIKNTPLVSIECKYMKRLSFRREHLLQAKNNARLGTLPAVVIKEANTGERIVVMDYNDWLCMYGMASTTYKEII